MPFTANNDPELVLHLYEEHGDGFRRLPERRLCHRHLGPAQPQLLVAPTTAWAFIPFTTTSARRVCIRLRGARPAGRPEMPREVDQLAIAEFLTYDHVLGQRTLLKEAHLLPQASLLKVSRWAACFPRYWTLEYADQYPFRKEEEYSEQLLFHLRQAVRRQASSDQPTGLMLSGGLDSRFILGLMAENKVDAACTPSPGAFQGRMMPAMPKSWPNWQGHSIISLSSNPPGCSKNTRNAPA
jgi:asparagine synthase (glutamine-hydrolysing)